MTLPYEIIPRRRTTRLYDLVNITSKTDPTAVSPREDTKTINNIISITQEPIQRELPKAAVKTEDPIIGYHDIDHYPGRLFIHVWADKEVVAVTTKDITFKNTEDYMVMILRFPYSGKGQYFATPSAFIDTGFAEMDMVETYDELVELGLD